MRINTNIDSMNSIDSHVINRNNIDKSLEKLSSGLRINKASDDASGLVIADKLRTQQNSISQSISNANGAVSMIQIADKSMGEQSNIIDIIKQKLIQASTSTTSDEGRDALSKDINNFLSQLNNIASQTNYNGINLLQDGASPTSALIFQIGETDEDTISTSGNIQSNVTGLGLTALKTAVDNSVISQGDAKIALQLVDNALDTLNKYRADFGSTQVQIESASRNLMTQKTNIAAAESVIRDVDYAAESANFNKFNIMTQSSTYAQAQANSRPSDVLRLLV